MAYTGRVPAGNGVDGVLCWRANRTDVTGLMRGLNVPVVGLDRSGDHAWPSVSCCDESIGRAAAEHLLTRGHRTLAFCGPTGAARLPGFKAEAEAAGARVVHLAPPEGASVLSSSETIRDWMAPMLSSLHMPLAVMVAEDLEAPPVIDALVGCGYSVPEQVAVVSAGNDPMLCDVAQVPVSSVDVCAYDVGYEAARFLAHMMEGAAPPSEPRRIAPGPVKVRASTDAMALSNLHAARALRFIWTHYRDPINVESVSGHVPVTRRRLQTLFQEQLGRTMQEEIARVRLAEACLMLKRSRMRIHEIATLTGFKSSLHLHRTAQSILGMGPKAFRETGTIPDFGVLPAQVGDQLPPE